MNHFFIHETTGELMYIKDALLEGPVHLETNNFRDYSDYNQAVTANLDSYNSALQAAKQGAVRVKNAKEVMGFIYAQSSADSGSYSNYFNNPGQIYSLEGYKVEIEDGSDCCEFIGLCDVCRELIKIAIVSPVSVETEKEESQEQIWIEILLDLANDGDHDIASSGDRIWLSDKLSKQFYLTRKP